VTRTRMGEFREAMDRGMRRKFRESGRLPEASAVA